MFRRFKGCFKRHRNQPQNQLDVGGETIPDNSQAPDHWQIAYDKLNESEKRYLSITQSTTAQPFSSDNRETRSSPLRTDWILGEVVRITKEQYEEYQRRGIRIQRSGAKDIINVREIAQTILDSV